MTHLRRRAFISKVSEVPIMSFKTNKNGTFNPSILVSLGTLKWVIDGTTYITNSPSVALTGSDVDVEVFANDVLEGVGATSITFDDQNIKDELDCNYFNITTSGLFNSNLGLTSLLFSSLNTGGTFRVNSCNLTTLDLSSWTSATFIRYSGNSNLVTVTSPTSYNTALTSVNGSLCAMNLASVNEVFSKLNTFMSANAPTADCIVLVNGGTNASPTGGSSNTDLVNLRDVVYPNAGFTFTANIN